MSPTLYGYSTAGTSLCRREGGASRPDLPDRSRLISIFGGMGRMSWKGGWQGWVLSVIKASGLSDSAPDGCYFPRRVLGFQPSNGSVPDGVSVVGTPSGRVWFFFFFFFLSTVETWLGRWVGCRDWPAQGMVMTHDLLCSETLVFCWIFCTLSLEKCRLGLNNPGKPR